LGLGGKADRKDSFVLFFGGEAAKKREQIYPCFAALGLCINPALFKWIAEMLAAVI
jgi:hypothetical protein